MTGAVKYALGFSTITASGQGGNSFKEAVQKELSGGDNMTQDKNQPSDWAKEAWEWAKKEGITDNGSERVATREEVITMLYRYYKKGCQIM